MILPKGELLSVESGRKAHSKWWKSSTSQGLTCGVSYGMKVFQSLGFCAIHFPPYVGLCVIDKSAIYLNTLKTVKNRNKNNQFSQIEA